MSFGDLQSCFIEFTFVWFSKFLEYSKDHKLLFQWLLKMNTHEVFGSRTQGYFSKEIKRVALIWYLTDMFIKKKPHSRQRPRGFVPRVMVNDCRKISAVHGVLHLTTTSPWNLGNMVTTTLPLNSSTFKILYFW